MAGIILLSGGAAQAGTASCVDTESTDYELTRIGSSETGDNGGLVTGNQVAAILEAPVKIKHTAVAVAGDAVTR